MVGRQGGRTGVGSVSVQIVWRPYCSANLRVYWHFYWEHSVRRNRWRWVIGLCVTKQRSEFTVIPTRINVHKTITLLIPWDCNHDFSFLRLNLELFEMSCGAIPCERVRMRKHDLSKCQILWVLKILNPELILVTTYENLST